jgi:hypothetical protein
MPDRPSTMHRHVGTIEMETMLQKIPTGRHSRAFRHLA